MTPPPDSPLEEGRRWLALAEGDLHSARILLQPEETALRNVGFMAQQAVENALKALLAAHDLPFPRVHDLRRLSELLPDPKPDVPANELAELNPWAVQGRYELEEAALDRATAAKLVELAARTVLAASRILESWTVSEDETGGPSQ